MSGIKIIKRLLKVGLRSCGLEVRRIGGFKDPFAVQKELLGKLHRVVIVDVGAYEGETISRYKELFPGGTVYAFEPSPASYQSLKNRFARSAGVNCSSKQCQIRAPGRFFTFDEDRSRNSLFRIVGQSAEAELDVVTTTLDEFCTGKGISQIQILKVDAEGADLRVLKGAARLLESHQIELIFLEVMFQPHYEGADLFYDVCSYLYGHGYCLHDFYNLKHTRQGALRWGNALFRPA